MNEESVPNQDTIGMIDDLNRIYEIMYVCREGTENILLGIGMHPDIIRVILQYLWHSLPLYHDDSCKLLQSQILLK